MAEVTKRHFEYLAYRIAMVGATDIEKEAMTRLSIDFGRHFNPRFNEEKFRDEIKKIEYKAAVESWERENS